MVYDFTSNRVVTGELSLNNCGIQTVSGSEHFSERVRDDYTVMYLAEGHSQLEISGNIKELNAGEAMLFLPGAKQRYRYSPDIKSTNMWVHFSGTFCDVLAGDAARIIKISDRNEFESNIERLVKSHYIADIELEILRDAYLRVLIAQICRDEKIQKNEKASYKTKYALRDVLNDINMKPAADFSWDEYAAKCFMSRDRFNHVFREHVGISPERYRIKIRMERAKMLLCDFGMSVGECAETLGFRDVSYFCKRFRREYGVSPGEMRKK